MELEELLEAEGLDAEAARETLEWARGRAAEIVSNLPADLDLASLLEGVPSFEARPANEGARPANEGGPPPPPPSDDAAAAPEAEMDDSSSLDIADEVEAGAEVGLPPAPEEEAGAGEAAADAEAVAAEAAAAAADLPPPPERDLSGSDPKLLAGVPDTGSMEALMSEEIELIEDDDLIEEIVEDGDGDEESDGEDSGGRFDLEQDAASEGGGDAAEVADDGAGDPEATDEESARQEDDDDGVPDEAIDDDISLDLDLDLSDLDDL